MGFKTISTVLWLCFVIYTIKISSAKCCAIVVFQHFELEEKILCRRRLLLFYVFLQVNHISREIWVHPLNEDRASKGEFFNLYCDQRYFGDRFFLNYRMSVHQFDDILRKITPYIKKKHTNFRSSISAEEKLCLTIRCVDLFCILLPLINKQTDMKHYVCQVLQPPP